MGNEGGVYNMANPPKKIRIWDNLIAEIQRYQCHTMDITPEFLCRENTLFLMNHGSIWRKIPI